MEKIIISATLLISIACGQSSPLTTFGNTLSNSNTDTSGVTMSSFAVDYLTVDSNKIYPFAFPVDQCLSTSLIGSTYHIYRCMVLSNMTMLFKEEYSTSDCSGNATSREVWPEVMMSGLVNSFYCDGSANNDYFFSLSASSCNSDKDTMSVAGVCWFNSDDNDTVTQAYTWECDTTGSGSITFKAYNITGPRTCSGTLVASVAVSNTTCTTVGALGSVSAKVSNNHCPSGGGGSNGGPNGSPTTTDGSSSNAVILTVGIMSLIASFFAIILV